MKKMKKLPLGTIMNADSSVVLDAMPDNSVDVIYGDPEYKPSSYKSSTDADSITDRKIKRLLDSYKESDGLEMRNMLGFFARRFLQMRRVLKDNGSIYIHCDHEASGGLKQLMNFIFGKDNFRHEIIWASNNVSGYKSGAKNWIRGNDIILYYVKNDGKHVFNKQTVPLNEKQKKAYNKKDENGRFYKPYKNNDGTERRSYLDEHSGVPLSNVWTDIPSFQTAANSPEIIKGKQFETANQKPGAIVKRIILASSNSGDVIFDPFSKLGTTAIVAKELDRNWFGCESNPIFYKKSIEILGLENQVIANEIEHKISEALKKDEETDVEKIIRRSMKKEGLKKYGKDSWIDYGEWGVEVVQACHILGFAHKGKAVITWNGMSHDLTKESIDFRYNIDNIILQSGNRHEAFDRYITSYDPNTGKPVYTEKQEYATTVAGLKKDETVDCVNLTEGQKKFMQWHFNEFCKQNPEFNPPLKTLQVKTIKSKTAMRIGRSKIRKKTGDKSNRTAHVVNAAVQNQGLTP